MDDVSQITINGMVDAILALPAPNKRGLACIAKGQKDVTGWIRIRKRI